MKKAYRYNELDELDWESKHGCIDEPCGDECWDEAVARECAEMPEIEDFDLDDETGPGIFGFELNHEKNAKHDASMCISNGYICGLGGKTEILDVISRVLNTEHDHHFEFKFFDAK